MSPMYATPALLTRMSSPPSCGHRLVDGPRDLLGSPLSAWIATAVAAVGFDLGDQLLGLGCRCPVGERDRGAVGRQPPHDLRADAA